LHPCTVRCFGRVELGKEFLTWLGGMKVRSIGSYFKRQYLPMVNLPPEKVSQWAGGSFLIFVNMDRGGVMTRSVRYSYSAR